jgi:hypothetical protein
MDFDQAIAITAPTGLARARLERGLDAADEAHRETVSERLAVSRYCPEMDADLSELQALAGVLARAGRLAALRLNRLAENNLSVPDDAGPLTARDLAERFEEALDGLLLPSAARVVGAACALEAATLPPA